MGGGVIARRKKTGREREGDAKTLQLFFWCVFICLRSSSQLQRAESKAEEETLGQQPNFFPLLSFPASDLGDHGKRSLVACFFSASAQTSRFSLFTPP